MHVEFSPADDAQCAVAMIWQGDQDPKISEPNWTWINDGISAVASPAEHAVGYAKRFRDAVKLLVDANSGHLFEESTAIEPSRASTAAAIRCFNHRLLRHRMDPLFELRVNLAPLDCLTQIIILS